MGLTISYAVHVGQGDATIKAARARLLHRQAAPQGDMNWTRVQTRIRGFSGAEAVYVTEGHLMAKWDHSRCRGWQLYEGVSAPDQFQRTRWIAGAGSESLAWADEQALKWAEAHIGQNR